MTPHSDEHDQWAGYLDVVLADLREYRQRCHPGVKPVVERVAIKLKTGFRDAEIRDALDRELMLAAHGALSDEEKEVLEREATLFAEATLCAEHHAEKYTMEQSRVITLRWGWDVPHL